MAVDRDALVQIATSKERAAKLSEALGRVNAVTADMFDVAADAWEEAGDQDASDRCARVARALRLPAGGFIDLDDTGR